jgi:UDP-N-acetylmuramate: L-alanyl-gamma-D-glutamyl-meso-diaminopimelate ligase
MHAENDNPELLRAKELGIKIYSYPEFVYKYTEDKQRIVIAGSDGKTTVTAMILHVLKFHNKKFDYLIGAELEGFDRLLQLSDEAPIIIIEGDEYPSSAIDPTPKFLHYRHHMALINTVAWDHSNVYFTYDEYVKQFENLADATPKAGMLFYSEEDDMASVICRKEREDVQRVEYNIEKHEVKNGITYLITDEGKIPLQIFGRHNLSNLEGARAVCNKIGISNARFYEAISTFRGAASRLELLAENDFTAVYKDVAHAPSRLKACTNAAKERFPGRQLVTVLELPSTSSLNKEYLPQYRDCLENTDHPFVYYNPETIEKKHFPALTPDEVKNAFNNPKLCVLTDFENIRKELSKLDWKNKVLVFMTSGNFDGINLNSFARELVNQR